MGPGAEQTNEWLEKKLCSVQTLCEGRGIAGQQEDRASEMVSGHRENSKIRSVCGSRIRGTSFLDLSRTLKSVV